jgi:hypothetical protein
VLQLRSCRYPVGTARPIAAELIVLSEHVDYWNDIGWKDPYSSHEYSERQSAYAAQFGLGGIYTPQMVVDGQSEFVGGDERRAKKAIENASKVRKTPVSISSSLSDETMALLHIETERLPSTVTAESADVFLAIANDNDESHVSRGRTPEERCRRWTFCKSSFESERWTGPQVFPET